MPVAGNPQFVYQRSMDANTDDGDAEFERRRCPSMSGFGDPGRTIQALSQVKRPGLPKSCLRPKMDGYVIRRCVPHGKEAILVMGPGRRSDRKSSPISEIDVLWITAGLGCDGDTIAMTAATQPSIEDIVLGALPWIPKVHFHNPFLASENGEDFMQHFHLAAEGKSNPFILVLEGSVPDESNKKAVSYTHLDVYKRQVPVHPDHSARCPQSGCPAFLPRSPSWRPVPLQPHRKP